MKTEPRPPVHHGPPRRSATAGDTLFAVALAGLLLALAGGLLAAGGGLPELAAYLPGAARTETAEPAPASPQAAGPILAPAAASPAATTPAALATPAPVDPALGSPLPAPTSPAPAGPFTMNLYREGVFVHEVDDQTCVAAAVQGMLNLIRLVEDGATPDVSEESQRALYDRIEKLTTYEDSHNGGTGPGGWAALLTEEGYPYEVRSYPSRTTALRAAARAIQATGRPVGVLAWTGIHSWVMTGFTATADPATTRSFGVSTAYVMDPWYPWVSTRWPRSEAPNVPRNTADLAANFLPFNLPSGPYPGRDGQFVLVVPLGG